MTRIRVGLVGCGTIANIMHLPGVEAMREWGMVELVAVCDAVPEKAREAALRFDAHRHYGDLTAMLEGESFDLLINNTPIPQHFPVTMAALKAGRHVYTQKPMSITVDEATTLIETARAQDRMLAVAPEHPVRPQVRAIRRAIDAGAIGKVTFARVVSSHNGPETHDVPRDSTWFYKQGSSPILDLGVHGLSTITAILGPVRAVSCLSGRSRDVRITTAGPFRGKEIGVEIDDNSLLGLDFGDARFAFMDSTYCMPATLAPHLEIFGTEGTLAVVGVPGAGPLTSLHHFRSDTKEWREIAVPPAPALRDLGVHHMVGCLREGTPLELTGERGRHLVEVMAAAPTAAATGQTQAIGTTF